MKKQSFIIVILCAIAAVSIWFVVTNGDSVTTRSSGAQESTSSEIPSSEPQNEAQSPASGSGEYVEYSDDAIANAQGDVYLFFHAPWCPQCRSIESGIETDGVPADTTVIKVDYDSNQALRQKYGVTLQTSFVKVTNSGESVSKFVAYEDPTFSSVVRDYFNK